MLAGFWEGGKIGERNKKMNCKIQKSHSELLAAVRKILLSLNFHVLLSCYHYHTMQS